MKIYCVGFMFDDEGENVLLIQKNRPEWQAGLFNGIGGKVESSESPAAAMIREFEEEAGVCTTGEQWHLFALMKASSEALIYFYRGFSDGVIEAARTMEDEPISLWPVASITALRAVPNLHWLIPMALNGVEFAEMSYPSHEATRGKLLRASTGSESAHSPAPPAPANRRSSGSADRLSRVVESHLDRIAGTSLMTAPDLCQADHESERRRQDPGDGGHSGQSADRQPLMSLSSHTVEQKRQSLEQLGLLDPQEARGLDT